MNLTKSIVHDLLSGINNLAADWMDRLKNEGKHIYLFGAGSAALCYIYTFQKVGVHIHACCDNNAEKVGSYLDCYPIVSFDDMIRDKNKLIVISAVGAFWDLAMQCEKSGIPASDICYIDWLWYESNERENILNRLDDVIDIYGACCDDFSKAIYIQALFNRYIRDRRLYKDIKCSGPMYFDNNILKLNQAKEVFLDCGAADGDTALQFINFFGGDVYAYEPDNGEFNILSDNVKEYSNIHIIHAGLGDKVATRKFNSTHFKEEGGFFDENGNQDAFVHTIDESLTITPTFIKMDIQGYEMNALRGAEKTIREHKPKMAICIYHKMLDFVDIPQYVLSIRPDYKLHVRQYRSDVGDTVCYFV